MIDELHICAVIVYFNRKDEIKKVLNSLLNQSVEINKILIIDNASEVSLNFEGEFQNSKIEIITLPRNIGGAGGFNFGMKYVLENYKDINWLWIMDDDAIPSLNAMENLLKAGEYKREEVGALCSSVYENGAIALNHRRTFNFKYGVETNVSIERYSLETVEIDEASFVGLFLKTTTINKIGFPIDKFFIFYDDTEYSLRMRKNNFKIILIPSSSFEHIRNVNSSLNVKIFSKFHYYNIRNSFITKKKYTKYPYISFLLNLYYANKLFYVSYKDKSSFKYFIKSIYYGFIFNTEDLKWEE